MFQFLLQFLEELIDSVILSHQAALYVVLGGYGDYFSVFFLKNWYQKSEILPLKCLCHVTFGTLIKRTCQYGHFKPLLVILSIFLRL